MRSLATALFVILAVSPAFATEGWYEVTQSPYAHDYGVGIAATDDYIFLANSGVTGPEILMRYDIDSDHWTTLGLPSGSEYYLKNSIAMDWDRGEYLYVLFGGSYSDCQNPGAHRYYFRRYNVPGNSWETLSPSPHYQGPGDAMAYVEIDSAPYIYAILGTSSSAAYGYYCPDCVEFWRYNIQSNTWDQELSDIPYGADDGASLVWTNDDYLYAFPGAYTEGLNPSYERFFLRYTISTDTWTPMTNVPYNSAGGVDDGGTLVYPGEGDLIYALKGGNSGGSSPATNCWRYRISTNAWFSMTSIPEGIGDQNGHRMTWADSTLYYWVATFGDKSLYAYGEEPPAELLVQGFVYYPDFQVPDSADVTVINLSTAESWTADYDGGYYGKTLMQGQDVNVGDVVRIIGKDPSDYVSVVDDTVTVADMDAGMIYNDLFIDIHYRDLEDVPFYVADDSVYAADQMTGAAAAKMVLDYVNWDSTAHGTPQDIYDQNWIFENASSGGVIDPEGMRELFVQEAPDDYHFVTGQSQDSSIALMGICAWIDYPVPADPYPAHVPVAVPTNGDYVHWMLVRGIHTSEDTNPVPSGPVEEAEIYGFWLNDPYPGGFGEELYVTADEFLGTYYLPIEGKYRYVAEPPQGMDESALGCARIAPARERYTIFNKDIAARAAREGVMDVLRYEEDLGSEFARAELADIECSGGTCTAVFTTEHRVITSRIDREDGSLRQFWMAPRGESRFEGATGEGSLQGASSAILSLLAPYPNPSPGAATIQLVMRSGCVVEVDIVDVRGRLVRRVAQDLYADAGLRQLRWDGRDSGGASVSSGMYFVHARGGGAKDVRRIVLLR